VDKIIIEGGRPLRGSVRISGAKNAALPVMAATILAPGEHRISNLPQLRDIRTLQVLLEQLGLGVQVESGVAKIDAGRISDHRASYELVKTMRASVLVLGPLIARAGRAVVSLPGGCAIGSRPIDQHLKGLEALGATISLHQGYVHALARRLKSASIRFDIPTVTGTENIMMAAVLAEGRTVLQNTAREPEVVELAEVLNKMGARIQGAGTTVITVDGVEELKPMVHGIGPDRIEAGTFMVAAAVTGGEVVLHSCPLAALEAVIRKLRETGTEVSMEDGAVRVIGRGRPKAVDITTQPYPGFPTDMQAQMMSLLCLARGTSVLTEGVFEKRFMHVSELRRMGAMIQLQGPSAIVKGTTRLTGAPVMATDLRASASLILAGLAAEGITEVSRVYHLDRGYEKIERKLLKLGARIRRVPA
jgi:UDP-N-acetylglucosamine 1-carboxyvinyltransferase